MNVFWRNVKRGQNLVIDDDDGHEEIVGGYRESKRGIDAYAKTLGYDPDRSKKGFETLEDAKAFVESFSPWELLAPRELRLSPRQGPCWTEFR